MNRRTIFLAAALAAMPVAALAAEPANSLPSEVRLTPRQIEQVLADAAKKRETGAAPDVQVADQARPPLPVSGEVGVSVGTGGYRSVFGAATIGLGDQSSATFVFEDERGSDRRHRRTRR